MEEKTLTYLYTSGIIAAVVFTIVMCVSTFGFGHYGLGVFLGMIIGPAFGWLALKKFQTMPGYVKG